MIDTRFLCHEISELASEVGEWLVQERRQVEGVEAESKGVHDYVTRFDRESERRIVQRLRRLLPEGGFIAEEGSAGRLGTERYTWIIDPIDGTTNFIHAFPPTCISIALQDNRQSVEAQRPVMLLGVVYELWGRECFSASADQEGASLNGKAMQVSRSASLNDSLIATGFPYKDFGKLKEYMSLLEWTMTGTHGVRRLGSAAADLAYVACGRADGFFEYGLKPYDVAAGAYLVEKAGGRCGDFHGGFNWLHGGEMVASNPAIFSQLVEAIKSFGL